MSYEWFGVRCPSEEEWHMFARKFDSVKAQRQELAKKALGHAVDDQDWMIFDAMLSEEYLKMKNLLAAVDEKFS
jgi:hypothetical protein